MKNVNREKTNVNDAPFPTIPVRNPKDGETCEKTASRKQALGLDISSVPPIDTDRQSILTVMLEINAVASLLVSRSKYSIKLGWADSSTFISIM